MKKIVVFSLFVSLAFYCFAQEESKPLSFFKVVQTEGKSTEQVYNSVRTWFALSTKDANKVLAMDDKSSGSLVGNVNVDYSYGKMNYAAYDGIIDFVIQVNIRDGRFRIEIKNFNYRITYPKSVIKDFGIITTDQEKPNNKGLNKAPNQKVWEDVKVKMEKLSEKIFLEMEDAINSNSSQDTNDDW